jgi:DNA-binding GntR family transcriptional regulator
MMNTPQDDGPLWRVIADQLRDDIGNEVYAPGAPLPGETAMAERYQTSRPTVRRAIFELAAEGLISAAQGRGTFVRARPDRRPILIGGNQHPDLLDNEYDAAKAGWLRSEHPDAAHYRAKGYRKVTDTIITGATRDQAEALGIKTGTWIIYRFQHWRHTQTQRIISLTSTTPAHLIGFFDRPDREPDATHALDWTDQDSWPYPHTDHPDHDAPEPDETDQGEPDDTPAPHLYEMLAEHGPISYTTSVNARMPRGDELNDLGTESGIPLLQITRTMTDPHGRPLECTMIEAASDRIEAQNANEHARTPSAILTL